MNDKPRQDSLINDLEEGDLFKAVADATRPRFVPKTKEELDRMEAEQRPHGRESAGMYRVFGSVEELKESIATELPPVRIVSSVYEALGSPRIVEDRETMSSLTGNDYADPDYANVDAVLWYELMTAYIERLNDGRFSTVVGNSDVVSEKLDEVERWLVLNLGEERGVKLVEPEGEVVDAEIFYGKCYQCGREFSDGQPIDGHAVCPECWDGMTESDFQKVVIREATIDEQRIAVEAAAMAKIQGDTRSIAEIFADPSFDAPSKAYVERLDAAVEFIPEGEPIPYDVAAEGLQFGDAVETHEAPREGFICECDLNGMPSHKSQDECVQMLESDWIALEDMYRTMIKPTQEQQQKINDRLLELKGEGHIFQDPESKRCFRPAPWKGQFVVPKKSQMDRTKLEYSDQASLSEKDCLAAGYTPFKPEKPKTEGK